LLNIVKTKQNNITMFSYTHCIMKRFVRQVLMFQKSHLRRWLFRKACFSLVAPSWKQCLSNSRDCECDRAISSECVTSGPRAILESY